MFPHDYFQINVPIEAFAKIDASLRSMGFDQSNLAELTRAVGEERLAGRVGGAVSLAVGMAQIFSGIPGMRGLMSYWYHFAIMFEGIVHPDDGGCGDACGALYDAGDVGHSEPQIRADRLAAGRDSGQLPSSHSVDVSDLDGFDCHDLAAVWHGQSDAGVCGALCGHNVHHQFGKARYAWVTMAPLVFISVIELTAGYQNVVNNYWPKRLYLNTGITVSLMIGLVIVIIGSALKWYRVAIKGEPHKPALQPLAVGQD
jgi:carbon starvation protein